MVPVVRGFLALTLVILSTRFVEAGELVVIASGEPSLRVGSVIDGGDPIAVAAGASVVLVSEDGRTISLTGPFTGAPDPSPPTADGGLVDSLSRLIADEAGSPETLAVFRSGLGKTPIGRPDVWGIRIAEAGRYCVRPDRPPMLWWPAARTGAVVKLSEAGEQATGVRIRWPASKKYAPWPDALAISDSATYVVRFRASDPGTEIETVLMPALETDAHRAAWMAEHGCPRQALAVLDAMGKGGL